MATTHRVDYGRLSPPPPPPPVYDDFVSDEDAANCDARTTEYSSVVSPKIRFQFAARRSVFLSDECRAAPPSVRTFARQSATQMNTTSVAFRRRRPFVLDPGGRIGCPVPVAPSSTTGGRSPQRRAGRSSLAAAAARARSTDAQLLLLLHPANRGR